MGGRSGAGLGDFRLCLAIAGKGDKETFRELESALDRASRISATTNKRLDALQSIGSNRK